MFWSIRKTVKWGDYCFFKQTKAQEKFLLIQWRCWQNHQFFLSSVLVKEYFCIMGQWTGWLECELKWDFPTTMVDKLFCSSRVIKSLYPTVFWEQMRFSFLGGWCCLEQETSLSVLANVSQYKTKLLEHGARGRCPVGACTELGGAATSTTITAVGRDNFLSATVTFK